MVCDNCHTTLPDDAVACWKCGRQFAPALPLETRGPDVVLAIVTFFVAAALFACLGWSIPFTVWGLLVSAGKEYPEWSGLLDAAGGISFVVTTVAFVGGSWYGSYWLVKRVNAAPGGR